MICGCMNVGMNYYAHMHMGPNWEKQICATEQAIKIGKDKAQIG